MAHIEHAVSGVDEGLRSHMTRTYALLAWGLAASAASAWAVSETALGSALLVDGAPTGLGLVAMLAPLALLLAASFGALGRSLPAVRGLYWAFVTLQGVGLAVVVQRYTGASVVNAAAATAAAFASVSLYGYTTRRNLTGLGSFMLIGLVGIIVAAVVNIFLGSPALDFAISAIAVVVFAGLAAWETQRLKEAYDPHAPADEMERLRTWAALGLYLDIVNLFTAILNLTGERD